MDTGSEKWIVEVLKAGKVVRKTTFDSRKRAERRKAELLITLPEEYTIRIVAASRLPS